MRCDAMLCCAVLCCAVLCCAMPCHAMPCYAMLTAKQNVRGAFICPLRAKCSWETKASVGPDTVQLGSRASTAWLDTDLSWVAEQA